MRVKECKLTRTYACSMPTYAWRPVYRTTKWRVASVLTTYCVDGSFRRRRRLCGGSTSRSCRSTRSTTDTSVPSSRSSSRTRSSSPCSRRYYCCVNSPPHCVNSPPHCVNSPSRCVNSPPHCVNLPPHCVNSPPHSVNSPPHYVNSPPHTVLKKVLLCTADWKYWPLDFKDTCLMSLGCYRKQTYVMNKVSNSGLSKIFMIAVIVMNCTKLHKV